MTIIGIHFTIIEFENMFLFALKIVAQKLASADFDGLRGLVKDDVIERLGSIIENMNDKQRAHLYLTSDDICKRIVTGIEFIVNDGQILVEISMVYHLVKGFKDLTDGNVPPNEFFNKATE